MASLSLAFEILAKDAGASRTMRDIGDTAEDTGKRGEGAGRALAGGLKVGALAAAAGLAGLAAAASKFVVEAQESQRIGKLTEAVIKSTGGVANVSADQVDKLTTALSNKSAIDDELIQNSANVLLTFTNIRNAAGAGNDIFDQGATAALNLSAALGTDLQAATTQVGKALNDPIAGLTGLSKAGIQFTDQQKEQIKTLTESGDVLGAQKIVLGELETQFGGAAEAAASPIDRLKVVLGNLGEQVGAQLLPTVERFATYAADVLAPAVAGFIEQFQNGEGAGGRLRDIFERVSSAAQTFGGFVAEEVYPRLVQFAGFVRDEVVPRVQALAERIRDDVLPRFRDFGTFLQERVFPALLRVAGYLRETFQPTADSLVTLFREKLVPGFQRVKEIVDENRPAFEKVAAVIGTVAGVVVYLQTQLVGKLLPVLVQIVGYIVDYVIFQFQAWSAIITLVVGEVTRMYESFQTAKDLVRQFITKVGEISVPGPLKDIAELVERIGQGIGGAASGVAGFVRDRVGDIEGSFRGVAIGGGAGVAGTALAKVQAILPAGLRITSTYRDPAHNARVGGSPTSLHMNAGNPAVDIAGPVGLMDAFAQQLATLPGTRQLLYRTAGHFDHIHYAHNGGTVDSSWPTLPNLRSDERPAILQTGERVQSRAEVAAGSGGGNVYVDTIVAADPDKAVRALRNEMRIAQIRNGMRASVW